MRDRLLEVWADLRVRWYLLDAQQKQVILLASLYLGYTLLDVAGAVAKTRIQTGGTA